MGCRCCSYGIPSEASKFWYQLAVFALGCMSSDILMGWNLSFLILGLLAEYMGTVEGDRQWIVLFVVFKSL